MPVERNDTKFDQNTPPVAPVRINPIAVNVTAYIVIEISLLLLVLISLKVWGIDENKNSGAARKERSNI